jgi:uncharacterized protein (TIGR03083 family)
VNEEDLAAGKDRLVALLGDEWAAITALLTPLDDEAWARKVLPGWDVHDTLAHMVGTELALSGAATPEVPAGVQTREHVRNDIGKVNEMWVAALRARSHADLLAEFTNVTSERLASLSEMSVADFNAPSWTPAGQGTYRRFMEIRVFDCWMHEQDIRTAVGMPGNEDGPAAERSLAEVAGALGYIIGKRGRAPEGSSVLITLTGPLAREYAVVTSGRAKVVEAIDGEPTATLAMSSSLFLRLAGGREDLGAALDRIEFGGDINLARQLASNLAFTI